MMPIPAISAVSLSAFRNEMGLFFFFLRFYLYEREHRHTS